MDRPRAGRRLAHRLLAAAAALAIVATATPHVLAAQPSEGAADCKGLYPGSEGVTDAEAVAARFGALLSTARSAGSNVSYEIGEAIAGPIGEAAASVQDAADGAAVVPLAGSLSTILGGTAASLDAVASGVRDVIEPVMATVASGGAAPVLAAGLYLSLGPGLPALPSLPDEVRVPLEGVREAFATLGLLLLKDGPDPGTDVGLSDIFVKVCTGARGQEWAQVDFRLGQSLEIPIPGMELSIPEEVDGFIDVGFEIPNRLTAKLNWDLRVGFGITTNGIYINSGATRNGRDVSARVPEFQASVQIAAEAPEGGGPGITIDDIPLGLMTAKVTDAVPPDLTLTAGKSTTSGKTVDMQLVIDGKAKPIRYRGANLPIAPFMVGLNAAITAAYPKDAPFAPVVASMDISDLETGPVIKLVARDPKIQALEVRGGEELGFEEGSQPDDQLSGSVGFGDKPGVGAGNSMRLTGERPAPSGLAEPIDFVLHVGPSVPCEDAACAKVPVQLNADFARKKIESRQDLFELFTEEVVSLVDGFTPYTGQVSSEILGDGRFQLVGRPLDGRPAPNLLVETDADERLSTTIRLFADLTNPDFDSGDFSPDDPTTHDTIPLEDWMDDPEGHLKFGFVGAAEVRLHVDMDADHITGLAEQQIGLSSGSLSFPSLSFDLKADPTYTYAYDGTKDPGKRWTREWDGTDSMVADNVTLDVRGFLTDVVGPFADYVKMVLSPLNLVFGAGAGGAHGVLTKPLPMIDDIVGHDVSFASLVGVDDTLERWEEALSSVNSVADLVKRFGGGKVVVGCFTLRGENKQVIPCELADLEDQLAEVDVKSLMKKSFTNEPLGKAGLSVDLLTLDNVFNLVAGRSVALVSFRLPRIDKAAEAQFKFGWDDLSFAVGGHAHLQADLAITYDTKGLELMGAAAAAGELPDPDAVLEGLGLSAGGEAFSHKTDVCTEEEHTYEAALGVCFHGSGHIDLAVFEAKGHVDLQGDLGLDLTDPDEDGTLRYGEIKDKTNGFRSPEQMACLLEIIASASVNVGGSAEVLGQDIGSGEMGLSSGTFKLSDLLDAAFGICGPPAPKPPVVAEIVDDNGEKVLRVNTGPFAAKRLHADADDDDARAGLTIDLDQSGSSVTVKITDAASGAEALRSSATGKFDVAGVGRVVVVGSPFADRIDASGLRIPARLTGGDGDDRIIGGEREDQIRGDDGSDTLDGRGGNDEVFGGDGGDRLVGGGEGDDILEGGRGDDVLSGGIGNDLIIGGAGSDTGTGDAGDDRLNGEAGADSLDGGPGNDAIEGGPGDDPALRGGAGSDGIRGGIGDDVLDGGPGDDKLAGDSGSDRIEGGTGDDHIDGGTGDDVMLSGGSGDDRILGASGRDKLSAGPGSDTLDGGLGDDVLISPPGSAAMIGGVGNDKLTVTSAGPEAGFTIRSESVDAAGDSAMPFTGIERLGAMVSHVRATAILDGPVIPVDVGFGAHDARLLVREALATVSVDGGSGVLDRIHVNPHADGSGWNAQVYQDKITNLGAPRIEHADVDILDLDLGPDSDSVMVHGTPLATRTTINGGGSRDLFTLAHQAPISTLVVNGDEGNDRLTLEVEGDATDLVAGVGIGVSVGVGLGGVDIDAEIGGGTGEGEGEETSDPGSAPGLGFDVEELVVDHVDFRGSAAWALRNGQVFYGQSKKPFVEETKGAEVTFDMTTNADSDPHPDSLEVRSEVPVPQTVSAQGSTITLTEGSDVLRFDGSEEAPLIGADVGTNELLGLQSPDDSRDPPSVHAFDIQAATLNPRARLVTAPTETVLGAAGPASNWFRLPTVRSPYVAVAYASRSGSDATYSVRLFLDCGAAVHDACRGSTERLVSLEAFQNDSVGPAAASYLAVDIDDGRLLHMPIHVGTASGHPSRWELGVVPLPRDSGSAEPFSIKLPLADDGLPASARPVRFAADGEYVAVQWVGGTLDSIYVYRLQGAGLARVGVLPDYVGGFDGLAVAGDWVGVLSTDTQNRTVFTAARSGTYQSPGLPFDDGGGRILGSVQADGTPLFIVRFRRSGIHVLEREGGAFAARSLPDSSLPEGGGSNVDAGLWAPPDAKSFHTRSVVLSDGAYHEMLDTWTRTGPGEWRRTRHEPFAARKERFGREDFDAGIGLFNGFDGRTFAANVRPPGTGHVADDPRTFVTAWTAPRAGIDGVHVSATGQKYALRSSIGDMLILDESHGWLRIAHHVTDFGTAEPFRPQAVAASPDGNRIYVAGARGVAQLEPAASGELRVAGFFAYPSADGAEADAVVGAIEVTADGGHVYVTNATGGVVYGFAVTAAGLEPIDTSGLPVGDPTGALPGPEQDGVFRVPGSPGAVDVDAGGSLMLITDTSRDAVLVASRNPSTGGFVIREQLVNGADGVRGLDGISDVAIAPNGVVLATGAAADSLVAFTPTGPDGAYVIAQRARNGSQGISDMTAPMSVTVRDGRAVVASRGRGVIPGGVAFFGFVEVREPASWVVHQVGAERLRLETSQRPDEFVVGDVPAHVAVHSHDGADLVGIKKAVQGFIDLDLGDGGDEVAITSTGPRSAIGVRTGGGDDVVDVPQVDRDARVDIDLGTGADTVGAKPQRTTGHVTVKGANPTGPNGDTFIVYASDRTKLRNGSRDFDCGDATPDGAVAYEDASGVWRYSGFETVDCQAPPLADTGGSYRIVEGETLALDGSRAESSGEDARYDWDLDGDGIFETPGQSPAVPWGQVVSDSGRRPISLRLRDSLGADTATTTLDVGNVAPAFALSGSGSVDERDEYTLKLSVTDPGDDQVEWITVQWGDLSTPQFVRGVPEQLTHTYSAPGTYTVRLATAKDEDGLYTYTDVTHRVEVRDIPGLSIAATYNGAACDPCLVHEARPLTLDLQTNGRTDVASWQVSWGDGTSQTTTAERLTHTWDGPAGAVISAVATLRDGSIEEVQNTVVLTVHNVAPVITVTGPDRAPEGPYTIEVSARDEADDTTSSWFVDWGDGTLENVPATTSRLTHAYDGPSRPRILVAAADEDGTFLGPAKVVDIYNVAPRILSATAPDLIDEGDGVTFVVETTDPAGKRDPRRFEFDTDGDGVYETISFNGRGSARYADDGQYRVAYRVDDGDGGRGRGSFRVRAKNVAPTTAMRVGGLRISDPAQPPVITLPEGGDVAIDPQFLDPGDDTVSRYAIDWGDGSPAQRWTNLSQQPSHVFRDGSAGEGTSTTIAVRSVTDEDGNHGADAAMTVRIIDVPPKMRTSGPVDADDEGRYRITLGEVQDPGDDTISRFFVSWGDGRETRFDRAPRAGEQLTHQYEKKDRQTIRVVLVDEDGPHVAASRTLGVIDPDDPFAIVEGIEGSDLAGSPESSGSGPLGDSPGLSVVAIVLVTAAAAAVVVTGTAAAGGGGARRLRRLARLKPPGV